MTVTLAKIMGKYNRKTAVGPHTKPGSHWEKLEGDGVVAPKCDSELTRVYFSLNPSQRLLREKR